MGDQIFQLKNGDMWLNRLRYTDAQIHDWSLDLKFLFYKRLKLK